MKKTTAILAILALIVPTSSAFAAELRSEYLNNMPQQAAHILSPVHVTAQAASEITAEHGINLILDEQRVLWHETSSVVASGTAVDNGKVSASPQITYTSKHKVLHIPVLADFANGEVLTLTGLTMRTYDREFTNRFMGLDLTGDMVAESNDLNAYSTNASERTDQIPPYPVTNLQYAVADDLGKVDLSWEVPDDYDIVGIYVDRTRKRAGQTTTTRLMDNLYATTLEDKDVKESDEVTYKVWAKDRRNDGEMSEVSFVVVKGATNVPGEEPEVPEEEEEEEAETEEETPDTDEVRGGSDADLSRLFNYYRVRYSIKCMPSGKAALPGDSACLWAKIDMAYAQARLGRSDVNVSLTENNLDVIGKRLQFSSQRYEDNCVEASSPADYCPALGKALARAEHFLGE